MPEDKSNVSGTERVAPHPAVFLDRDGTIIEEVGYLDDPARITFLPGSLGGLQLLQQAGFRLVVVSNQSGIARGYFSPQTLHAVQAQFQKLLMEAGVHLDGFYYCPHHPQATLPEYRKVCRCRKPAPGMLYRAQAELNLDLARSFLVGDKISDIQAGQAAGVFTVLVRTGYGQREMARSAQVGVEPDAVAADLLEAARIILARQQARR